MTQFVIVIDASIVNVALPSIGRALHFSQDNLSWVVNAYTLTFGGFLLLGGRLADLLGRRRMFMIGLVVFSLASLAGGLAQSQAWLIAARSVSSTPPSRSAARSAWRSLPPSPTAAPTPSCMRATTTSPTR
jgi:MFS family permease